MTLKEFAIELPALRDEAKALWGTSWNPEGNGGLRVELIDQYQPWYGHFTKMITSDDPVKYLKDHSKGEK